MKRHEPKNKWIAGVCSTSVKHSLAALVKQRSGGCGGCGIGSDPIARFYQDGLLHHAKCLCCLDCDDSCCINRSLGCIPLCHDFVFTAVFCCALVLQQLQDRAARPGCKIGTRITQEPQNKTFFKTISGHCFCRSFSLRSVCCLETFVLLLLYLLLLLTIYNQHTYTLCLFTSLCFLLVSAEIYLGGGKGKGSQGSLVIFHVSLIFIMTTVSTRGTDLWVLFLLIFFFYFFTLTKIYSYKKTADLKLSLQTTCHVPVANKLVTHWVLHKFDHIFFFPQIFVNWSYISNLKCWLNPFICRPSILDFIQIL